MLINEIREGLIHQENQLARLHADIYQRREEARNIRLSMPTPEQLDSRGVSKDALKKLENKKKKALCSIHRLNEKTNHNIQTYMNGNHDTINNYGLTMMIIIIVIICVVVVVMSGLYLLYPRSSS